MSSTFVLPKRLRCAVLAFCALAYIPAYASSCVPNKTEPSEAEALLGRGEFKKASPLLDAALAKDPNDTRSRYLQVELLLAQSKIDDAQKKADAWTSSDPKSGYAILSESEVRYAEGDWTESYALALKSLSIDPCMADAYDDLAQFENVSGYHATARKHLALAHQLAPTNRAIRLDWIYSLNQADLIPKLREYIEDSKNLDEKKRKASIASLDRYAARQEDNCALTSASGIPVRIPMSPIILAGMAVDSWGLEVLFNGKSRILQIDTGASGFTLTQSVGSGLGLAKIEKRALGGIGSEGGVGTQLMRAASVRIGGVEFKNCEVDVLDRTGIMGGNSMGMGDRLDATDGLVGADIFNHYLVTLDYIKHEVRLEPLPQPQAGATTPVPLDALGGRTDPDWMIVDRVIDPSMKSWTKIYRNGHDLIMPTRLANEKGVGTNSLFIVDTGASTSLIDIKTAKQITKTQENTIEGIEGLSGKMNKIFDTGKFTLDFAGIRQPVDHMTAADIAGSFGQGVSGFLGYPTLHQLVVHIDYRDNLMYFEAPNGKKL